MCRVPLRCLSDVKRPEPKFDYLAPSVAQFKDAWSLNSPSPFIPCAPISISPPTSVTNSPLAIGPCCFCHLCKVYRMLLCIRKQKRDIPPVVCSQILFHKQICYIAQSEWALGWFNKNVSCDCHSCPPRRMNIMSLCCAETRRKMCKYIRARI
jgi:hypothetical protein